MQFSERISRISVSSTAAVLQKADKLRATGAMLVDFGAGEPDFPTPDHIKQAAVRALEQNFTKYTPTGGTRELKDALVDRHAKDFGSHYSVEECLVTVGGKQAIFEAMVATLNDGDEVILPAPYWVSFLDIIHYAGGKVVFLGTEEAENFAVRAEAVEKLITPRTRMIVVNSPNNPTGAVVPRGEMERLLEVAARHNVLLLSDECYCQFLYDDPPFSLGSTMDREHVLVVGSLSKTYAMTGWRVGFALGSNKLLAQMLKLQSHSTSNPTSIAQKAAVEALRAPQDSVRAMLAEYRRRRDRVVEGLRNIPNVKCMLPQGAFYAYPNVSAYLHRDGLADTTALAEKLLDQAHVAVVPGSAFGTEEHIRISYAASLMQIDEGLRRMKAFFAQFQSKGNALPDLTAEHPDPEPQGRMEVLNQKASIY
jgi:aspartate aminotransferase